MDEQIQQGFIYHNKTYKTLAYAQSAKIKSTKKKIHDLMYEKIFIRDVIEKQRMENRITKTQNKLDKAINEREITREKQQKEKKRIQKLNRINAKFFTNNFDVENNAQQKLTLDERLIRRNRAIEENKIPINGLNFQEKKDIRRVYEVRALGGRITENYFEDENILNGNRYVERNEIIKANIMNQLYKAQNEKMLLKAQLTLKFIVELTQDGETFELIKYATSTMFIINTKNDILNLIVNLMEEFERAINNLGHSSLKFKKFTQLIIRTSKQTRKEHINLMKTLAGNYIELSEEIKKSQGVSNIKNLDDKCLEYCLIAFRYKNQIKSKDTSNPNIYKKYFQFIKSPENQKYPISIEDDVPKYEELNDIKIVVYKLNNGNFLPFFKSNYKSKETLNLLLIEDGKNNHLCLIKNMSRLTHHLKPSLKNKTYFCDNCHVFESRTLEGLEKHMSICTINEESHIKLPTKGKDDIMQFVNHQNEFEHPYYCFVDFESTLNNVNKRDDQETIKENDNTTFYQKHVPNSYGIKFDCIHDKYSENYKSFVNKDDKLLCKTFIEELEIYAKKAYDITQKNKQNILWKNDEKENHKKNKSCNNCKCKYDDKNYKVAHHDHINGNFIDSYCNSCNLKFQYKKFLPVYIHNLKGYDSHLFINALYNYGSIDKKFSCIPNNEEKYISFSKSIKVDEYYDKEGELKDVYFEIRFIDTYAILSASLDSLVENLKKGKNNIIELRKVFKNTSDEFKKDDDFLFMISKGVYPYDYINNFDKLYETKLPHRKYFYSRLYNEHIKPKEYARAIKVFQHFKCKNILEYHELYLKADVLLLSDIWKNFKNVCLVNYKLDPAYYLTAPSLSWDAFLKVSKIKLELITDYEMYLFFEEGIRGGLSQISTRYAKANNKYMKSYDKTKPDTYISYFDANNLYGHSMCEYLPYKDFKWNNDEWDLDKILNLSDTSNKGYLFSVDLHIPEDKHEYFNNYTPLPLNKVIKKEELNPLFTQDYKESKIKKLCCSLDDRINYKVNYRLLKLVLNLGFKLIKVNKVVEYEQKPFMKEYILLNTELRKKAKSDFEKDFFKLMNNSCYGKTMENVRNRIDFKLVSNVEDFDKLKRIKKVTIFNETLVGAHLSKYSIKLNKPIYMGQNILDDSKLLMNNFHYNFMMKKIESHNLKLLFTDTDSLAYEIKNNDIYEIMKNNKSEFDLSNFENDLHDKTNNKVIGKFKDECPISPIIEFVGLRSKVYSYLTENDENCKKNKGIKKSVVEKYISHNDYKNCLFNNDIKYVVQNTFRSYKHNIYTVSQRKKALSSNDDKIYICDNNIDTYTHGHKYTKK